jgi:surfeit locus 1 family protein
LGIGTTPKSNRARRAVYGAGLTQRRRGGIAVAPGLLRNLLRGRWLVITIVVLLAAGVMVRLGIWQMSRLQGRRAANVAITRQINAPPLLLDVRTATTIDPATLIFRRVTVRGTWDYAHEVELRYRSFDGQAGIHVLTPLRIAGGDTVVLVDRGWIPYQDTGPEGRRAYQQGESASIEGLVYESHAQSSASSEPGVFSQIDVPAIGAQLPYPLVSYWVQRLPSGDNQTPPRSEGPPPLDDGSHLGYMIQWWAFAATLLVTYLVFANQTMLRERRKRAEGRGQRAEGAGG